MCLEKFLPCEKKIYFSIMQLCDLLFQEAFLASWFRTSSVYGDGVVPISVEEEQEVSCQRSSLSTKGSGLEWCSENDAKATH